MNAGAPSGPSAARRWGIWAVVAAIFVISHFHRVAPAVVARELMGRFGASAVAVSALAAIYFYVYAAMQIPSGLLADRLGPRRLATAGAALMALGSAAFGAAPTLSLLYLTRFVVGLGASVIFVSGMRLAASWFPPREYGMMAGLMITAGGLGSLLGTTPLAVMVEAVGWPGAFELVGAVTALLAGLAWGVVRDHPPETGGAGLGGAPPGERGPILERLRRVLGNPRTWPPFVIFFGLYGTFGTFAGLWGVPYLRDVYGFPARRAAGYAFLLSLGFMVGGPVVGWLSDRFLRRRPPMILLSAVSALLWGLLAVTRPPEPWLPVLYLALGLAASGIALTWVLGREVNPPGLAGLAVGAVNLGGFVGVALLQVLAGLLLDTAWGGAMAEGARVYPLAAYQRTFLLAFSVMAVTTLVATRAVETRGRNVYAEPAGRLGGVEDRG